MAIRRTTNGLESNFTTIPNSWIRDTRLSFRARGLLAMLLSHSAGWEVTISSLASQNKEGKDAILTAVRELERFGYLSREDGRSGGRFDVDWVLQDPPPAVDGSTVAENPPTVEDLPRRFNRDGSTATENPPLKKNSNKKTNEKEDHEEVVGSHSSPKGHRVPENFMPAQKHIDKIRRLKPGLNLDIEHTKFMNHWLSSTGRNATKKDWGRAWENWMLNAREERQEYKPGWQRRAEFNAQQAAQYGDSSSWVGKELGT